MHLIIESRITPDVIVILRGGGSAEDLASFNDPDLVKRIAACQIPIITAIGHETDTSLADLQQIYGLKRLLVRLDLSHNLLLNVFKHCLTYCHCHYQSTI